MITANHFKALLRRHAAAVVVVTVPGDPPAGFTATSFTSVSLEPPIVSFCLARTASVWPAVAAADTLAVQVLSPDQERVARIFSTPGIDRFAAHGQWRPGPKGVPLLDGVLAWMTCRILQRVSAGDHTIVLAEPCLGELHPDDALTPLLYHAGGYARVAPVR